MRRGYAINERAEGGSVGPDVYSADEVEFMNAVDRYKRERNRPFPTWDEVLAVAKSLGYRKLPACLLTGRPPDENPR